MTTVLWHDRHEVENTIREGVRALNSEVVVGLALLVIVLLISPIIILLVRMVTRTLQASSGVFGWDLSLAAADVIWNLHRIRSCRSPLIPLLIPLRLCGFPVLKVMFLSWICSKSSLRHFQKRFWKRRMSLVTRRSVQTSCCTRCCRQRWHSSCGKESRWGAALSETGWFLCHSTLGLLINLFGFFFRFRHYQLFLFIEDSAWGCLFCVAISMGAAPRRTGRPVPHNVYDV